MTNDKLDSLFSLRQEFMRHIESVKPGTYPEYPVDITTKESQQLVRDLALKGVEEMFEALGLLKNWKPHRDTDRPEINQEEFLEEVVDAFNYFLSMLVLVGVSSEELYRAYLKKDKKIHARLSTGYQKLRNYADAHKVKAEAYHDKEMPYSVVPFYAVSYEKHDTDAVSSAANQ